MRSKRLVSLLVLPALALGALFYTSSQVSAVAKLSSNPSNFIQVTNSPCYVLADNEHVTGELANQDFLSFVDFMTGAETGVGYPGTTNVEAIAFQFSTGILFGANGGQMGTFNLTNAAFTDLPNPVGSGNGSLGTLNMTDIDSLSFDPITGILYGAHRKPGADVMIQINHTTGRIIPGAFGTGVDYVPVTAPEINSTFNDIDDIAIDPVDGQMYGILNSGGTGDWLVRINKATGAATSVNQLGVDDMEGLSFEPTGMLMGTTGKDGPAGTRNRLFRINKNTGVTDVATSVPLNLASDYEASDCLTSAPVVITPTPTPTETPTPTNTPTPTPTFTPTPTEPTAVELLYFRVSEKSGQRVTLSWATASEIGTYSFALYRSRNSDFSRAIKVHSQAARGGHTMATYQHIDTVPAAGIWWYWLEETLTQGGTRIVATTNTGHQVFVPILMTKAQP